MTYNSAKLIEDYSDVNKKILLSIYNQAFKDCSIAIKEMLVSNFYNLDELNNIIIKIDETVDNTDNSANSLIENRIDWNEIAKLQKYIG